MKNRPLFVRDWTRSLFAVAGLASLTLAQDPAANAPLPTPGAAVTTAPNKSAQDSAGQERTTKNEAAKYVRFVRAAAQGAKVRNVYDAQGVVIGDVAAQGILAVYSERAGWLEVETPGGLQVWVYGEFVRPTDDPGVVEITGDAVHMRPLPSRGTESMPIKQSLTKGEKVRFIGRHDVALDLSKDWVNIWSPVGARGWVPASETVALAAGVDGSALWATAVGEARRTTGVARPASASTTPATNVVADARTAGEALSDAERKLATARDAIQRGEDPNVGAVRQAFEAVLAMSPGDATTATVRERLRACDALAEAWTMTTQLQRIKADEATAQQRREADLARAAQNLSPDARFQARGWIERRTYPNASGPVYTVVFAGSAVAELRCTSGRFDLEDFVNCEIGFNGTQASGPTRSAQPGLSRPEVFDVSRIEVLALRARRD